MTDELAHAFDDLEIEKANYRRAIKDSLILLSAAHHALGRNKYHVVDDHLDRVISALTKSVAKYQ